MSSSIGGILNTARSALLAYQRAGQVVSHNIGNASTEGYSRQRPELLPTMPLRTGYGVIGTGVHVADVERVRDALLDVVFRRESTNASAHRLRADLLGMVEVGFSEPGEHGLGATLDAFWASWGDLANDPTSAPARTAVQHRGRQLANELRRLSGVIDQAGSRARHHLEAMVDRLNDASRAIAELNTRIVAAESGGRTASDLRDDRDRLIDELAGLAGVRVTERENGAVAVAVAGVNLVDGAHASELRAVFAGGGWTVQTGSGKVIAEPRGAIGAALEVLDADLPALRARLDDLARAIVTTVNDLHAAGTNPAGDTGVDFFDDQGGNPAAVTAHTIALSPAVAADAAAIAAGAGSGTGAYQAGANDIALALAQLRDTADNTYLDGRTFGDYFTDAVQDLGIEVQSASASAEVHESLVGNAQMRRQSVSGVSIDEELIDLMQFQAAYGAAARVVTSVDEMLESLLNMV